MEREVALKPVRLLVLCLVLVVVGVGVIAWRWGERLRPAPPTPMTLFATYEGVPVRRTPQRIGDEPVRLLTYGEAVSAFCDPTACEVAPQGSGLVVEPKLLSTVELPARRQYARGRVAVSRNADDGYSRVVLRHLEPNEAVEVRRIDTAAGAAMFEIGHDEWVWASEVQDHPETDSEKEARLSAEAIAKEQRKAEIRRAEEGRREQAQVLLARRKSFAGELRTRYLDAGYDIKVSVTGSRADRLKLQYVLFNDVWSHRYHKDGEIDHFCRMGFTRVDMSNGYNWGVKWTYP